MRLALLTLIVSLAACGRIAFDPLGRTGDALDDGLSSSGDGSAATSCAGVGSTCGPLGDKPCCDSPLVTGGTFYRSYDVAADMGYPDMSWPATISDFRLDTYEVTVARFRRFVEAGQGIQTNPPASGSGAHPNIAGSGWDPSWNASLPVDTAALRAMLRCNAMYQTWTDSPASGEQRPIGCINWYEAMAFCAWDGGYLPTEAQRMYVAAGGSEQRVFPWSSPPSSPTLDCSLTNWGGIAWPNAPCVVAGANGVGSESPAGDGKWGQADLSGNMFEWELDWYAASYPMPCTDCANLTPATWRTISGGSYAHDTPYQRVALRYLELPTDALHWFGVRCAR